MSDRQPLHRVVLQDLEYLDGSWQDGYGDDSKLRRDSTTLRKLLLGEQLLKLTWTDVIGPVDYTIYALKMPDFETEMPSLLVGMYATLGGFSMGNATNSSSWKFAPTPAERLLMSDEDVHAFNARPGLIKWPMSLKDFVNATCAYGDGTPISRGSLITFTANKLGGAHFDSRRTPAEEAIDKLANAGVVLGGLHEMLYSEILATIQDLVGSPDTQRLIRQLRAGA